MKKKIVLVVGMARSGIAVAGLLRLHGALVRINDLKTEAELGSALDPLRGLDNIEWRLGEKAIDCLEGCDVLLISPGVRIDNPAVLKAKEMGISVTGELEYALSVCKGQLIAITGTNGKTTTTTLVGEIMQQANRRTYIVGNIGNPVSAIAEGSKDDDAIVCEVSSFQFETVKDFHPQISAILNISEDHLYRHKTMENYIAHKARIFMNQGDGDTCVLNYDDAELRKLIVPKDVKIAWFSRTAVPPYGAFVVDGQIAYGTEAAHQIICATKDVNIKGGHNLENALAATAIALAAGIAPETIRECLMRFSGVEHRMEFVRTLDGVNYINDSKGTNVDSTLKAILSMERPTVIMLGGENKDADFTALAEEIARCKMIKRVVVFGAEENGLAEVLEKAGVTDYVRAGMDFDNAIAQAKALTQPGDNILFSPACKSFDMFKDYEDRGREFKRRVHAL